MADDISPLDALAGMGVLGFGILLGYTTWKKVPGGAIGALKNALRTGSLIHGVNLPAGGPIDGPITFGPGSGPNNFDTPGGGNFDGSSPSVAPPAGGRPAAGSAGGPAPGTIGRPVI